MVSEDRIDRYELFGELGTGGMATVYVGRQRGPHGFARTVAIKSMHPQYAKDGDFRAMFLDEAVLTAQIRHPSVVPALDLVSTAERLLIVMEYVEGASLSTILAEASRRGVAAPIPLVVAIMVDVLEALHAAHELVGRRGEPVSVVHRDVSPQNVLVGVDGVARILDFGIAKASTRSYVTQGKEVKGKLAYMPPEQLRCDAELDRRADVYAAGVVLWEMLAGRRLLDSKSDAELARMILDARVEPPSMFAGEPIGDAIDSVVMNALAAKRDNRWASAKDMARALAAGAAPGGRRDVTALVKELAKEDLERRAKALVSGADGTALARVAEHSQEATAVFDVLSKHAAMMRMESAPLVAGRRSRSTMIGVAAVVGAAVVGAFVIGTIKTRTASVSGAMPPATSAAALAGPEVNTPPAMPAEGSSVAGEPTTDRRREAHVATPTSAVIAGSRPMRRPNPAVDCRTKYEIDAEGHRHYKPACVE